jgi:hypothetical protein
MALKIGGRRNVQAGMSDSSERARYPTEVRPIDVTVMI